jgi:hypothetical protein
VILLIFASHVSGMTGMSHYHTWPKKKKKKKSMKYKTGIISLFKK